MLRDTKRMWNIKCFLQQAILGTNITSTINSKASRDKLVKMFVLARNQSQTTKNTEIQVSSHCSEWLHSTLQIWGQVFTAVI